MHFYREWLAMRSYDDAYGRLIYDHWQGKEAIEIVEREDGFISVSGGPVVYFSAYTDWPAYEQEAMAYARGRVLDIGCGAGRHALYLQEQGLVVTGIDNSPVAVACTLPFLKSEGERGHCVHRD
jgi:SAM-dependent methyltransferase